MGERTLSPTSQNHRYSKNNNRGSPAESLVKKYNQLDQGTRAATMLSSLSESCAIFKFRQPLRKAQ